MEYLLEFILDLVLESGIYASKNKKVPKFIRYLLIFIISLFFLIVISLIILVGILFLKESIIGGILFILLGIYMLIICIIKFYKLYLIKVKE